MQITYGMGAFVLSANGYAEKNCKGDHHRWQSLNTGLTVTLPGARRSSPLSPNVVKSIERATGLSLRR